MKQIECPHCGKTIKIRTAISMTVDTGKPKETIPASDLQQIIISFVVAKGWSLSKKSFISYSKQAKELYFFCDKDLAKVLASIRKAKEYYENKNFDKWVLGTIIKQWDDIHQEGANLYAGW